MLLAALSALSLLEAAFNSIPDSHTIASVGWAGYIVASSFNGQKDVVSVSGSWTVPVVNASNGDGYSSAWIGIGGQEDKTLIQVGTEHNVYNGNASYGVWYEMLPALSTRINNFNVSPGDQISARISLVNSDFEQWNIQIADLTNGESYNHDFQYNSTRSSAEWILERSLVNGQISTLADFGQVTFTGCTVQVGNRSGVINDFTYSVVQMTNQQYERLATASMLTADGASFTVKYDKRT
jgi:Peptidase A4 family.